MIKLEHFKKLLNRQYIIIVTSNSVEKNAVNAILHDKKSIRIKPENQGCYIGVISDELVVHLCGSSGMAAQDSLGRCVTEFISDSSYPDPQMLIMCGFCWGNPEMVNPGEVIISNNLYSLNSNVVNQGRKKFRLRQFESPLTGSYLSSNCKNGPIASLESFISDAGYRDEIIKEYPSIYGGEMEGFGFIPTLQNRKIPWLIMKTVSDMADEQFSRIQQQAAAVKAAELLIPLLKELSEDFEQEEPAPEILHLKNLLKGDDVKIDSTEFTTNTITDFLNDTIGPVIESKLSEYFYTTGQPESEFIGAFCDVILEIIQNSFKHGGSNSFQIGFRERAIILKDDGKDYHLPDISGGQGGATAWKRIEENFLKKEKVKYVHSGANTHKFQLEEIKTFLRNMRERCSININPETSSRVQTRHEMLNYDPHCTALYLNARGVRMSSMAISIIEQARVILDRGLTIYISVASDFQARQYLDSLSDYGERVIILRD